MKKVSIILPTYNNFNYLTQSIESCLNQDYQNIELIIIIDGFFKENENIIKKFSDSRIKFFRNQKHLGLAESLNFGMSQANGEYLTWTSNDNYYSKNAISTMVKYLENHPEIDFVYTNYWIIDKEGKIIKKIEVEKPNKLVFKNVIGPCFLYKKEVYRKTGNFKKEFFLAEDYEYWLRVRKNFKMVNLNKFLYYYRQHEQSLSGKLKSLNVSKMAFRASFPYIPFHAKIYQILKVFYYWIKNIL